MRSGHRRDAGIDAVHLNLFAMRPVDDIGAMVTEQEVVWVGGGA